LETSELSTFTKHQISISKKTSDCSWKVKSINKIILDRNLLLNVAMTDDDPRGMLLKIDGVSYKFKSGTTRSTQRRFVGYIAQQIESVVPSAVQLIDGILHVDYESLIPYLSESIRQNYNDIKHNKHETKKIHGLIDKLFTEFTEFKQSHHYTSSSESTKFQSTVTQRTCHSWPRLIIALSVIVIVASAVLGVLFVLHQQNTDDSPQTEPPTEPVGAPIYPPELREFFDATNGAHWLNNTGWLSNTDVCTWFGITCDGNGNVKMLHLNNNNLIGSIPNNFTNIVSQLQELDFSYNNLTGTIPATFGLYPGLNRLILKNNKLRGPVPSFNHQKTSFLDHLDLSSNQLSGTLPSFDKLILFS